MYVALTRARQLLYISGSLPRRGNGNSWYHQIVGCFQQEVEALENPVTLTRSNSPPSKAAESTVQPSLTPVSPDPRLAKPLTIEPRLREIAPSHNLQEKPAGGVRDEDGMIRGLVIHQYLEWLCREPQLDAHNAIQRLTGQATADQLAAWWQEARHNFDHPSLNAIFNPAAGMQSYSELPLLYRYHGQTVNGVIDRLLINDQQIHVIDYKTHQYIDDAHLEEIAGRYVTQMKLYAEGIRRLWPNHQIKASLLFTACARLWPMQV